MLYRTVCFLQKFSVHGHLTIAQLVVVREQTPLVHRYLLLYLVIIQVQEAGRWILAVLHHLLVKVRWRLQIAQGLVLQGLNYTSTCRNSFVLTAAAVVVGLLSQTFLRFHLILLFQLIAFVLRLGGALLRVSWRVIAVHNLFYLSIVLSLSLVIHITGLGDVFVGKVPLKARGAVHLVSVDVHEYLLVLLILQVN